MTSAPEFSPSLVLSGEGPVKTLTLTNPSHANAVTLDMHSELATVWTRLAHDDDVGCVILTGSGSAFSAGGDMEMLERLTTDEALRRRVFAEGEAILEQMLRFPKPLVASINGPAVGLGASMAISADVVLIADDAYLADPHVLVGVVAGDGGAALWPTLTCALRTREFLYLGDRIDAKHAVEVGLASRVVDSKSLKSEALRTAQRLLDLPQHAFQLTKRAVNLQLLEATRRVTPYALAAEHLTFYGDDIVRSVERFTGRRST